MMTRRQTANDPTINRTDNVDDLDDFLGAGDDVGAGDTHDNVDAPDDVPNVGDGGTTGFETLLGSIGCNTNCIQAIQNAGVISILDVLTFKESDVSTLCKIIRKDGVLFPLTAELNFKLMTSEAQIRHQTHRDLEMMYDCGPADFVVWKSRHDEKKTFKDPKEGFLDADILAKNWVKGFEQLEHWIGRHIDDVTGMPLAFAVRNGPADTNTFDAKKYMSLADEYLRRTMMEDADGKPYEWAGQVRTKVWNIMYAIFKDHSAYQYMRPYKRQLDGVSAYVAIRNHYLGTNNVNNLATKLEAEFDVLTYTQETRRWTFEKYVNKHVELYNTAQDLVNHGYCGIDAGSRVRKFLNGIKTDTLDVVKNQVLSDQSLAIDFDRVINLFKDFLAQKRALNQQRDNASANIAAVGLSGHKRRGDKLHPHRDHNKRRRGRSSRVAAVTIQDRYYSKQEYANLSAGDRQALYKLRLKSKPGSNISQVSTVDRPTKTETTDEENTPAMEKITNRNNPALRRSS
jgi:hypothetical protein